MKVLVTGANGYIGQRLIPAFLEEQGHQLYCCVRNKKRFEAEHKNENISILELDFLDPKPTDVLPVDIDVAYYLIHSMSNKEDFEKKKLNQPGVFCRYLKQQIANKLFISRAS